MAKEGLSAFLCAGALLCALTPLFAQPASPRPDPEGAINLSLAVQSALKEGRDQMALGNFQAAVFALEGQLSRIDGNRAYLAVLADAYRGYIKTLRQTGPEAEVQTYVRRLLILDPGAILEFPPRGLGGGSSSLAAGPASPPVPVPRPPSTGNVSPTVRMQNAEDPFAEFHARQGKALPLLERAEQEFRDQRYAEAARLFEQAHQSDPNSTSSSQERWGYCKLALVVQQLNQQSPVKSLSYPDLEKEVRQAMSMSQAPKQVAFGEKVLRDIADRQRTSPAGAPASTVGVKQLGRSNDGWYVAETANFLIYYRQNRDFADKVAEAAERTRTDMSRKWLGEVDADWNPRCKVVLYPTAQDYSSATGVPASSPGHSTMETDGGRVVKRRIDLHCDDPSLLSAVLPHEATHVILAGKFGDRPPPRWVDEGVAVLTEPRDKIDRHLVKLPQYKQDQQLFTVRQLLQFDEKYPEPRSIGPFYAQSVSVVEFLSREQGPQTFTRFVRDGMTTGYEAALKRHYGYENFDELEQRWQQHAIRSGAVSAGITAPR